jgi:hypothetical protein
MNSPDACFLPGKPGLDGDFTRSSRSFSVAWIALLPVSAARSGVSGALLGGADRSKGPVMALIVWYLGLVIAGDFLAYFVGLLVEYQFGGWASMMVFLVLYFVLLWAAWIFSVWITEPRKAAPVNC